MSNLTKAASAATFTTLIDQKMSSLDIAELANKRHKNVMRDIRTLIEQGAIRGRNFELTSRTVPGPNNSKREESVYTLDFHATMVLITGYDAKRRSLVIARWIELENGTASPAKKNPILALEGEIREGASLLAAVIAQDTLPDEHKWQLIDRLFHELFGSGVEILTSQQGSMAHKDCKGPGFSHAVHNTPIIEVEFGKAHGRFQVQLSSVCLHWFIEKQCLVDQKAAVSQRALYRGFVEWFVDVFSTQAPEFTLFHDAIVKRYTAITLVGEPWFVGIALDKEVQV